ncbi:hypothetical protein KIKIMORA_05050 [Brevundimonas phage vB_BpoS-Kikimora]|uniref:Uncharacterized protein n=1 Tax=Brevundimonas phage vB_BpoS-Kikimora TaxID=2948601 RepID=A0A9E7SKK6_9CAUD|nr:hypothetical protein KIKIMORA_05050 [Brevundimonas phage vB_BpoS-Kikimora]
MSEHAKGNAAAWLSTIVEQAAKLNAADDTPEPIGYTIEADGYESATYETEEAAEEAAEAAGLDDYSVEPVEGEEVDKDAVRQEIIESVLSVQVRDGWRDPGPRDPEDRDGAEEFQILLSTGGPALRLRGELGTWGDPSNARLQYQDWGTPWTDYPTSYEEDEAIRTWLGAFYFGEG